MVRFIVGAMALLTPVAAFAADTATADLALSGTVPNTCYVATNPTGTSATATLSFASNAPATESNGNTISWSSSQIIDPTTATANWGGYNTDTFLGTPTLVTINFQAVCNFAGSQVTASSANAGLRNQSGVATVGNFADAISYQLLATWGVVPVAFAKAGPSDPGGLGTAIVSPGGSTPATTVVLPRNSPMTLLLRLRRAHAAGSGAPIAFNNRASFPMLAGTYADTLTLRFGANP